MILNSLDNVNHGCERIGEGVGLGQKEKTSKPLFVGRRPDFLVWGMDHYLTLQQMLWR